MLVALCGALFGAGLIGLNGVATRRVWRSPDPDAYTDRQRWLQTAFIWGAPLVGAFVVLSVVRSDTSEGDFVRPPQPVDRDADAFAEPPAEAASHSAESSD